MYGRLRQGNREISVTAPGAVPGAASGRPEVVADDERGGEVSPPALAKAPDPLIVPVKPANKAAQAAAESAEGSGGTKRNADRQSTNRTQGREAVSQAQARIRGRCFQEQEGEANRAPAPRQHRGSGMGLLQPEEARGPGRRWPDVGPVRDRSGGQPRRSSRTGSCRNVSSAAIPPEVHTEGGWQTTAARHCHIHFELHSHSN